MITSVGRATKFQTTEISDPFILKQLTIAAEMFA